MSCRASSVWILVWLLWSHSSFSDGSGGYNLYGIFESRLQCQVMIPEQLVREERVLKALYKDVVLDLKLRHVIGTGTPADSQARRGSESHALVGFACLPDSIDPRPRFSGDRGLGESFRRLD